MRQKYVFYNVCRVCLSSDAVQVLRILPNDPDTVRTKLFLLLQTDLYNSALELLETSSNAIGPSGNSSGYQFDKAYVLYRLHREDEAREILLAIGDDASNRGVQHLDAQVVNMSVPHSWLSRAIIYFFW